MPRKVRELKGMLRRAGFSEASGRGSHVNFWYEGVDGTFVTISGNDGDDARRYQETDVRDAIKRAKEGSGSKD